MHIYLYTAVLNVKLLRYGFSSSLGLNLNFEIKSAHKLVVVYKRRFCKVNKFEFEFRFCKVNEFEFKN